MAKSKKTEINVSELLASKASRASAPKKKNGIPELTATDIADRIYAAYTASKDAEATFKALEAEVLEITGGAYTAHAKSGDFSKSFNVPGETTPGVQVSYKDAFTAIPIDQKAGLQEKLGERFNTYFEEKRELTLVDTSNSNIEFLLKTLGEETFSRIFSIKVCLTTKPDMDRKQFELDEDIRPKQYKPALKILK